jgi:hypothetical protein
MYEGVTSDLVQRGCKGNAVLGWRYLSSDMNDEELALQRSG